MNTGRDETDDIYQIDVEGRITGVRPTGEKLRLTQVASVLVAGVRSHFLREPLELQVENGKGLEMTADVEEGSQRVEVRFSKGEV